MSEFTGNPAMTCPQHGPHPNWAQVQLKRDELQTICLLCVHDLMEQHGVHIIREKIER